MSSSSSPSPFDNLYALLLAGGKGRRLWPASTVAVPKQFLDFFGTGLSQLQETYASFRQFLPASRILISTHCRYVSLVRAHLPDVPADNILAEPVWRNTGPSTAWGAYRIAGRDSRSVVVVAPCDQHILDLDAFRANIAVGAQYVAAHPVVLALGVRPSRPEPGYGYIQVSSPVADNIYNVRSFTEKPSRAFAEVFLASGEFLWNTGMVVASSPHLCATLRRYYPAGGALSSLAAERAYFSEQFPRFPNSTIEQDLIEHNRAVNVLSCDFGWADHGTWHGIYESSRSSADDNVVLDSSVVLDNAHNNIVKLPRGHRAVINGLTGFIVVEHDDTLFICPKEDSSALVRKYSVEDDLRRDGA